MGLVASRIRMLLKAKQEGAHFDSLLTLGRQRFNVTQKELHQLEQEFKVSNISKHNLESLQYRSFADDFFRQYLNAQKVSVMDYSNYQKADIIHDLNSPIDTHLEKKFDAVIDGGTLEHIFNFPVAIANCMKMVKPGGNLFIFSMANNHCGHGFYQFSPELFFRIFQKENGYKVREVVLMRHPFPGAELSPIQECFLVKDPAELKRRTTLVTRSPVGIMVRASRISEAPMFTNYPHQSDYTSGWNKNSAANGIPDGSKRKFNKKEGIAFKLRKKISGYHQLWKYSMNHDRQAYTQWK